MDTTYDLHFEIDQRERQRNRFKSRRKRSHLAAGWGDKNPSFTCKQCGQFVSAEPFVSGVKHRNHCPYCLWSRHLDLFEAGDRLAACKASMRPVGLTLKRSRDKYAPAAAGELMLIHLCTTCEHISINRIAADDVPETIIEVFQASLAEPGWLRKQFLENQINLLGERSDEIIYRQLYGQTVVPALESVPI